MIRSPKDRDTIPTMDTDVTEPQPSRDGSRRDDNPTWTTAVYRQLEPALARAEGPRIATVEENVEEHLRTMLREAENENGETDPHANDTEPEPLPPFTDGAATTGDAAADAEWRAMIATAEDDDPAFPGRPGETEQERVRRIMDGFARRAQQERVGPPVVARVTDGNPAAVYSAPPTAVPAATRTPHAPGRVHFAHTERLPLPVVPPPLLRSPRRPAFLPPRRRCPSSPCARKRTWRAGKRLRFASLSRRPRSPRHPRSRRPPCRGPRAHGSSTSGSPRPSSPSAPSRRSRSSRAPRLHYPPRAKRRRPPPSLRHPRGRRHRKPRRPPRRLPSQPPLRRRRHPREPPRGAPASRPPPGSHGLTKKPLRVPPPERFRLPRVQRPTNSTSTPKSSRDLLP